MTEEEIIKAIESKLSQTNTYTTKTVIIASVITFVLGCILGSYVAKVHFPTLSEVVKTIEKPVVTEKINTITDTKLAYVPGETVYLQAPASSTELATPVSKNTPGAVAEKLDGKYSIGKPDFVYMVNGKVGKFNKTDDEKFIFEKNMIDLKQSSTIKIEAEIPTIDLTRHNVLTGGVMYSNGKTSPAVGYTGSMGKVGAYQVVGSKDSQYVGIGIKF